jgi:hypothetical protein|nr:MAG TPA: hypothetical protein [Caudoviricetes sp.]
MHGKVTKKTDSANKYVEDLFHLLRVFVLIKYLIL